MSYVYINREVRGYYVELNEPLDSNYKQGSTYDDYRNMRPAPWIPLSEEQVSFREANPSATVKEVIEMTLDPERLTRLARSSKMTELRDAVNTRRSMRLDGDETYVNDSERRNALYEGAMTSDVVLAGRHYSVSEGRALVSAMDAYDSEVNEVYRGKMDEVNSAASKEDIEAVDASSGYPDIVELTTAEMKAKAKELDKDDPKQMAVVFARKAVNMPEMGVTANEALELQSLFPIWGEEGAEFGKSVEVGFRLRVVKRDDTNLVTSDILYEVIQAHTLQEDWEPGLDTASLYKTVDVTHAGTLEDPIPYFPPMELENGKYYIQDAVTYLCVRDSGIPLSQDLSELVDNYVTLVE